MKIVSTEEMRAIDRASSQRFGVPSPTLMENAGSAVADYVVACHASAHRIVVVCGKGNNGGDGLVAARKLQREGRKVQVILLASPSDLRGDAEFMFDKLPDPAIVVQSSDELKGLLLPADLYLDAILGTGFKPPVRGLYADAIALMNASQIPVIAVDIPSGADADGMSPQRGTIARADAIVTFTAPRPAHVFGLLTTGVTLVADIGSPAEAIVSDLQLGSATQCDYGPRHHALNWAAAAGIEQRQLRERAGGWRLAGESGVGGDGGDGRAPIRGRTLDRGHGEVRIGDRGRFSSRVDDRTFAGDGCGNHLDRSAASNRGVGERKDCGCDRPWHFTRSEHR